MNGFRRLSVLDPVLQGYEHFIPAGHRLALIVAGTDNNLIEPPSTQPTLTLDLSRTSARVPLVGGEYGLSEVATAHQDMRERRGVGKLVLDPTR